MKGIIFGANGFLGQKVYKYFIDKHDVIGTSYQRSDQYRTADITDKNVIAELLASYAPAFVINCAAICDLAKCESNKALALAVHVEGIRNIAQLCKDQNTKLVYISTDYIFDGRGSPYTETDVANPLSIYGRTKLQGEGVVIQVNPRHLIIRPTILYGYNSVFDKPNFVRQVICALRSQKKLNLDNERVKYPLLIDDFAKAIYHLLLKGLEGTYNLATEEGYTRYAWGKLVADVFGFDGDGIFPENTYDYNVDRPKNVQLIATKLESTGFIPRSLKTGLNTMKTQMEGDDE